MEKVLFICGLIPYDNEIEKNTINFMNAAANAFQKLFIEGFKINNVDVAVLSAPFIGPYPTGYRKLLYKAKAYSDGVKYVSFFNLWGVRNFSRYYSLKRAMKQGGYYEYDKVVVYSVHTPFANLAKQIKKKNPDCKICLITPDLPEFMNLRKKKSWLYRTAKKYDIKSFYNKVKYFDCFSLVSKYQGEKVNLNKKKEAVIEAIAKDVTTEYHPTNNSIKRIVYTGALNEQFGVLNLLSAVLNSDMDAQLLFCGDGDAVSQIIDATRIDNRIVYQGVVSHQRSREIQNQADILVNPRLNEGDYTRYSFPSKTMEYLSTGRPVVCYKLDGIPDEYDNLLIYPKDASVQTLSETLKSVLEFDETKCKEIFKRNTRFLLEDKTAPRSVEKILNMLL